MKPSPKPLQAVLTRTSTTALAKLREALPRAYSALSVAYSAALVGLGFTLVAVIGFYTLDWLFCVTHPGVCN